MKLTWPDKYDDPFVLSIQVFNRSVTATFDAPWAEGGDVTLRVHHEGRTYLVEYTTFDDTLLAVGEMGVAIADLEARSCLEYALTGRRDGATPAADRLLAAIESDLPTIREDAKAYYADLVAVAIDAGERSFHLRQRARFLGVAWPEPAAVAAE